MTFQEIFEELKAIFSKADVSTINEHLAFQFNITGEGAGSFYAEIKEGALSIEPYEYNDRDVLFTAPAKLLLQIAKGKADPILSFTLGKLKVEGDLTKALIVKQLAAH